MYVRMESENSKSTLPLVSIVVPIYNMEAFLADTLKSIQAIDYPRLEVILMDDGSTDDSARIASETISRDSRFQLYHQKNGGASAARNSAIRIAKGELILPIDADNLVEPTFVGEAVKVMMADKDVKVVTPRTDQFGLKSGEIKFPPYSIHLLARKNIIDACAMYRKADWERVGGYCAEVPTREDWEFWLSVLENGGKVIRLPKIEFHYRQHSMSKRHRLRHRLHEVIDIVNRRHPELYEREYGGPLRYWRSASAFLNRLYRIVHPRRALSVHFCAGHGTLIHKGRNQLRILSHCGEDYVVKLFGRTNIINRFVYGLLRKSKAQRSYEYALMLREMGIDSPMPLAWQTERNGLLLNRSFLVCQRSELPYTYADLIAGHLPNEELVLRSIAITTARLHNAGWLHKDYSRGNILLGFGEDGSVRVELIDLNRLRHFHQITMKEGCHNFAERLPATPEQRRIMAETYAKNRGFDAEECFQLMTEHNHEKS